MICFFLFFFLSTHYYFGFASPRCYLPFRKKESRLSSDFLFEVSILAVVKAWGRDTYLIRIDRRVTETEMEGNRSRSGLPKSILNLRSSSKRPSGSAAVAQTCNFMPKHNARFNSASLLLPLNMHLCWKRAALSSHICLMLFLKCMCYIMPSTDILIGAAHKTIKQSA